MIELLNKYKQIENAHNENLRQGAILRTKLVNFEENEVSIANLNRLEKLKGESNAISGLLNENGIFEQRTNNILKLVHEYYANLFKKEPESMYEQNFFLRNIENRVERSRKTDMDKPIDKDEIFDSLNSLQKNKSPGDDGLTTEFYKFFWRELAPLYLKVIREIKERKTLSPSQKRGCF